MAPSVLTVIACTPILAGWLAVYVYQYLSARRQRRHDTEWTRFAVALADLDADLDRIWGEEQARIRRPW